MRVPLSWLRTYAPLPDPVDPTEVSRRLTAAGLEVESLESVGQDIRGVVVAQVLTVEELTGLKKPIRYCRVAVSEAQLTGPPDEAPGVICGAVNFAAGDRVPLARRDAARRVRDQRAQDLRPHLRGHDLLGPGTGHRRGSRRHHRAATGRAARRRFRGVRRTARRG